MTTKQKLSQIIFTSEEKSSKAFQFATHVFSEDQLSSMVMDGALMIWFIMRGIAIHRRWMKQSPIDLLSTTMEISLDKIKSPRGHFLVIYDLQCQRIARIFHRQRGFFGNWEIIEPPSEILAEMAVANNTERRRKLTKLLTMQSFW